MGHGYIVRRGGDGLNFKVVGNPQPETTKENTIWVDTNTPVSGYSFSVDAPENPVEGHVWVMTGSGSFLEFNALKKNVIQVYPLSAKQYVSGAWVDKTAKIYQNGEWVEWWNGQLYWHGYEYEDVTGGWDAAHYKAGSGFTVVYDLVARKENSITAEITGVKNSSRLMTRNPVDVSSYDSVKVVVSDVDVVAGCTYIAFEAIHETQKDINGNLKAIASVEVTKAGEYTIPLDGIERCYIGFTMYVDYNAPSNQKISVTMTECVMS